MSEELKDPNGTPEAQPMAAEGENPNEVKDKADNVAYSTYRKVVGDNKKKAQELAIAREKLEQYEKSEQTAKEEQLKKDGEWQAFAEEQKKKAQEMEQQLQSYQDKEVYQIKLSKIKSELPDLDINKYHMLVDADSISYDPSTGEFDDSSVQKVIESFKGQYNELLVKTPNANFNGDMPKPNGQGQMSTQEYARLSRDEKRAQASKLNNVPDWMAKGR